jgi:hypothetical protein
MDDTQIREHIETLVSEEHRLLEHGDRGALSPDDLKRLEAIEVQLDQFWDLLRQRRRALTFGRYRRTLSAITRQHKRVTIPP